MLGQHRSTQRKMARTADDEAALTADIVDLAKRYGRYGYLLLAELEQVEHGDTAEGRAAQARWREAAAAPIRAAMALRHLRRRAQRVEAGMRELRHGWADRVDRAGADGGGGGGSIGSRAREILSEIHRRNVFSKPMFVFVIHGMEEAMVHRKRVLVRDVEEEVVGGKRRENSIASAATTLNSEIRMERCTQTQRQHERMASSLAGSVWDTLRSFATAWLPNTNGPIY